MKFTAFTSVTLALAALGPLSALAAPVRNGGSDAGIVSRDYTDAEEHLISDNVERPSKWWDALGPMGALGKEGVIKYREHKMKKEIDAAGLAPRALSPEASATGVPGSGVPVLNAVAPADHRNGAIRVAGSDSSLPAAGRLAAAVTPRALDYDAFETYLRREIRRRELLASYDSDARLSKRQDGSPGVPQHLVHRME